MCVLFFFFFFSLIRTFATFVGTEAGDYRGRSKRERTSDYVRGCTYRSGILDGVVERLVGGRLSIEHEDKYSWDQGTTCKGAGDARRNQNWAPICPNHPLFVLHVCFIRACVVMRSPLWLMERKKREREMRGGNISKKKISYFICHSHVFSPKILSNRIYCNSKVARLIGQFRRVSINVVTHRLGRFQEKGKRIVLIDRFQ